MQVPVVAQVVSTRSVQESQPLGADSQKFVARLLPKTRKRVTRKTEWRGSGEGQDTFMTVAQVAQRLGVSTATVYRLGNEAFVRRSQPEGASGSGMDRPCG